MEIQKQWNNRSIDEGFIEDLKTGILKPILEAVKADSTLSLEVRHDYIDIYYRGELLIKINQKVTSGAPREYPICLTEKYYSHPYGERFKALRKEVKPIITKQEHAEEWSLAFLYSKQAMDCWLTTEGGDEREAQQLLIRENNYGKLAASTDYFICDMEYVKEGTRFDLVAAHWPADGTRRRASSARLCIIEMKYGTDALENTSGLKDHIAKLKGFLQKPNQVEKLKSEMAQAVLIKHSLGLFKGIDYLKRLQFTDETPIEYLVILANCNPRSTKYRDIFSILESEQLPSTLAEIKLAVSTFAGYGLFDHNIYGVSEFKTKFLPTSQQPG